MITRIEIDGFKSFVDFELELKPFTVLAGANNSGKSNLLDAIMLLEASVETRGSNAITARRADGRSRGRSLMHAAGDGTRVTSFRVAVLVDASMTAEIRVHGDDDQPLLSLGRSFSDAAGARGPHRGDFVAAFAVRRFAPEPAVMRFGADVDDTSPLASSGENLAAVVARIQGSEKFPDFRLDASYVLGELTGVRAVKDERRRLWDLELEMRGGRVFTPAEVSDGTLRVLCLLAAVHDPADRGTFLVEEIENGLDPRYLGRLVSRLVERIEHVGTAQIIATTHSPVIVGEAKRLTPESVYLLGIAAGPRDYIGERKLDYFTHARSVVPGGERGTYVPAVELDRYLAPGSAV